MSRKRRRLLKTKWFLYREKTGNDIHLRRLHKAMEEGFAILFYSEEWLQDYRAQRKDRRPFLRRFRPRPTDTEGDADHE